MCQPTVQFFAGLTTQSDITEQPESDRNNTTRRSRPMNIKVAMRASQCLGASVDTNIEFGGLPSGPPTSTSAYSEFHHFNPCTSPQAYTAAQVDPSLPTPASSNASPRHQHKDVNTGFPYDASEEYQQPSPVSDCSTMFMQYEMGVPSQPSASINIQPSVPEGTYGGMEMVHHYMSSASPTAEITDINQYDAMAPCGVADPQNLQAPNDRHYNYPSQAAVPTNSLHVVPDQSLYGQRPLPAATPEQPNMMESQDPVSLLTSRNISPHSYTDFQDLPQLPAGRERTSMKPRVRKPKRKSDASARAGGRSSVSGPSPGMLVSNGDASRHRRPSKSQIAAAQGAKSFTPSLAFKDTAPPDLKRLLELRKEYNNDKGKGMWDDITKAYNLEFGSQLGEHDRARLQMKLTRGVSRFGILPKSEELLIIQAFEEDDKHKYERICARLAELGGGAVWPWKPAQIEAHLVVLGLEEKVVDERNNLRRKRREAMRRLNAANAVPICRESVDGITVEWATNMRPALASHNSASSPVALPSQAGGQFGGMDPNPMRRSSAFDMPSSAGAQQTVIESTLFTNDEHEELMGQLNRKYYAHDGDLDDIAEQSPHEMNGQHHGHMGLPSQFYSPDIKQERF